MNLAALLPIGAFSNATQLSAKALRLYAEHGILVPARIDADTGYRYYRNEQVRDARLVRLLRELDMPLAGIAALMDEPDAAPAAIKIQMEALARRYAQQQHACQALQTLLGSTSTPPARPPQEYALPAAATLVSGFEAHAGNLLVRAHALLARVTTDTGLKVEPGSVFVPLPAAPGEQEEAALDLCVPLPPGRAAPRDVALRSWPAARVAAAEVSMQRDAPDLVGASDVLFDWFDRRGYSLRDTPRLYLHPDAPQLVWPIS
jgi:DNA-binding transcriptional MerR regulator